MSIVSLCYLVLFGSESAFQAWSLFANTAHVRTHALHRWFSYVPAWISVAAASLVLFVFPFSDFSTNLALRLNIQGNELLFALILVYVIGRVVMLGVTRLVNREPGSFLFFIFRAFVAGQLSDTEKVALVRSREYGIAASAGAAFLTPFVLQSSYFVQSPALLVAGSLGVLSLWALRWLFREPRIVRDM